MSIGTKISSFLCARRNPNIFLLNSFFNFLLNFEKYVSLFSVNFKFPIKFILFTPSFLSNILFQNFEGRQLKFYQRSN